MESSSIQACTLFIQDQNLELLSIPLPLPLEMEFVNTFALSFRSQEADRCMSAALGHVHTDQTRQAVFV